MNDTPPYKRFRLHWLSGDTEVTEGHNIAHAFSRAGYGGGAIRALDWYEEIKEEENHEPPSDQ